MDQRTRIVAAVIKSVKLPPRFRLRLMKEDPVTANDTPALLDHLDLLCRLYNDQALELVDPVT